MSAQKWIMFGGLIALVFAAQSFLPETKHEPTKPIVYYKDEKSIRDALSKEETVKDITFTVSPGWIYVGVYSDGSNRNGYASYICQVIQPYILEDMNVKIVDYKDVLQKKGFTELGTAKCKASK